MSDRATGTRIGRDLVLVPVLALAAAIGLGVGWWLGTMPTAGQATAPTASSTSSEALSWLRAIDREHKTAAVRAHSRHERDRGHRERAVSGSIGLADRLGD